MTDPSRPGAQPRLDLRRVAVLAASGVHPHALASMTGIGEIRLQLVLAGIGAVSVNNRDIQRRIAANRPRLISRAWGSVDRRSDP